jgi:hypothetical protein
LFLERNSVSNGFFGNYYFYNLNQTVSKEQNVAAFTLINATSQDALAVYGAALHQSLLRKVLNN